MIIIGFPRTRGDRPPLNRPSSHAIIGSPAHAGIDPLLATTTSTASRFPRTRGDRPPPLLSVEPDMGSPAHAGIDPTHREPPNEYRWFPRTRGDRPLRISHGSPAHAGIDRYSYRLGRAGSPAHAGIDRYSYSPPSHFPGSPAHAGIDPTLPTLTALYGWFPRTRGDRPLLCQCNSGFSRVPPHTRG